MGEKYVIYFEKVGEGSFYGIVQTNGGDTGYMTDDLEDAMEFAVKLDRDYPEFQHRVVKLVDVRN